MEEASQIATVSTEVVNGAWSYFVKLEGGNGQCNACGKVLKSTGGNTTGLRKHLESIHGVKLASKRKVVHVVDCVEDQDAPETLDRFISRMDSVDGIPFVRFTISKDIRSGLEARGFDKIPRSPNSIRKRVLDYTFYVQEEIRKDIAELRVKFKLSLSLDEWSSISNRRYLNINVHANGRVINLGLHRITGSAKTNKILQLLIDVLADYGLELKRDIISITTDAATVMTCLGKMVGTNQQLCYAHGLHLAVTDNLFKKKRKGPILQDLELVPTVATDNNPDDVETDQDFQEGFVVEDEVLDVQPFVDRISPIIENVRRVSRIFRKSPTKNDDALQTLVKKAHGKELKCLLDCRTRWNSTVDMISRFLLLFQSKCLQQALVADGSKITFKDTEVQLLSDIESALEPLKITIKTLCRRDANLLEADSAINLLIEHLAKQTSVFSQNLRDSIIKRFMERRTRASMILQFLHSRNTVKLHCSFIRASSLDVYEYVVEIWKKYHKRNDPVASTEDVTTGDSTMDTGSFSAMLEAVLKRDCRDTQQKIANSEGHTVEQDVLEELDLFERTGVRGQKLGFVYETLLQIIPTSVEAERNFSASGRICNKITSRLSDMGINALSVLRFFFMNQQ